MEETPKFFATEHGVKGFGLAVLVFGRLFQGERTQGAFTPHFPFKIVVG